MSREGSFVDDASSLTSANQLYSPQLSSRGRYRHAGRPMLRRPRLMPGFRGPPDGSPDGPSYWSPGGPPRWPPGGPPRWPPPPGGPPGGFRGPPGGFRGSPGGFFGPPPGEFHGPGGPLDGHPGGPPPPPRIPGPPEHWGDRGPWGHNPWGSYYYNPPMPPHMPPPSAPPPPPYDYGRFYDYDRPQTISEQPAGLEQPAQSYHSSQSSVTSSSATIPLFITEEGLQKVDMPCFNTVCHLIDLYYRYVNPSYMVLPNRKLLVDYLSISPLCICLLSTMFKISSRYCSPDAVEDPKYLDQGFWAGQIERYGVSLAGFERLAAYILASQRGKDDHLEECAKLVKFYRFVDCTSCKELADIEQFLNISTPAQIIFREGFIRMLWNVYKFQVFRRVSFSSPYLKGKGTFEFPSNLELPMPDTDYYTRSSRTGGFKKDYRSLAKISRINFKDPVNEPIYDSSAIVVACHLLELVIDLVDDYKNMPEDEFDQTYNDFTSQLHKLRYLSMNAPFKVSPGNKMALNSNNMLNALVCDLSLIILGTMKLPSNVKLPVNSGSHGLLACKDIFGVPSASHHVLQSLSSDDIDGEKQWESYFMALNAAFDIHTLIRLGEGIAPPSLDQTTRFSTSIEPRAADVSAFSSVSQDSETWLQYPSFTLVIVIHCISILSTLCVFGSRNGIEAEETPSGIELKVSNSSKCRYAKTIAPVGLNPEHRLASLGEQLKKAADEKVSSSVLGYRMIEDINRYLEASGKYYEDVSNAKSQVDELLEQLHKEVF
ncbi:hypothetical protein FOA43_002077 [Brettanomyces nanus]|uniref:Uncharacterized protein n=1 Tax=Eeniella nana TaxID=13502 RepID=A0A875S6C6_EENNA|nr:uncharacterized protein FOA43_002077 [Brettanomyces nanus]QPG74744.1 hypothetical protein FOA43_002077 [Brettanomyces nanus]